VRGGVFVAALCCTVLLCWLRLKCAVLYGAVVNLTFSFVQQTTGRRKIRSTITSMNKKTESKLIQVVPISKKIVRNWFWSMFYCCGGNGDGGDGSDSSRERSQCNSGNSGGSDVSGNSGDCGSGDRPGVTDDSGDSGDSARAQESKY
jgi:hypothetical protein